MQTYNSFCDRLEKKKAPYVVSQDHQVFKLEIPLLKDYQSESDMGSRPISNISTNR